MINQISKGSCTGCGICSKVCPQNAVKMVTTFEGFLYPYVDSDKCIMCRKCLDLCSKYISCSENANPDEYYAFKGDNMSRWAYQGGAAFYSIAKEFNKNSDAVIFAPFFSEDYRKCIYNVVTEINIENVFPNPFIEHDISDKMAEIESLLQKGNNVLFYGIPCLSAALVNYLDKDYENLYIIDMICHGISSDFIWNNYLGSVNEYNSVNQVKVNSKELGCTDSLMVKFFENSAADHEEINSGKWLTNFKNGLFFRSSCCECRYAEKHYSDLTLTVPVQKCEYDDGNGVTLISVNSEKGHEIIAKLTDKSEYCITSIDSGKAIKYFDVNHSNNTDRKKFFEYCFTHGFDRAINYISQNEDPYKFTKKYVLDYHIGDNEKWVILNDKCWKKLAVNKLEYLVANGTKWNRIFLPLKCALKQDIKYKYSVKFKLKTTNANVRLMLSDKMSGDSNFMNMYVINSIHNEEWTIINGEFAVKSGTYKNIMLASTDFLGNDPYICFDWIRIWEAWN